MSNHLKGPARAAARARRLAFLRSWPGLGDLPGARQDVTEDGSRRLREVHQAMIDAGLYSVASRGPEARWNIRRLVDEVRRRMCPYGDPTCPCPDGDPCHYEGDEAAV